MPELIFPIECSLYFNKTLKKTEISELSEICKSKFKLSNKKIIFTDWAKKFDWDDYEDVKEILNLVAKYCSVHKITLFGSIIGYIGERNENMVKSKAYQIQLKKGDIIPKEIILHASKPRKNK